MNDEVYRPSALPKLAACAFFKSGPAGEAAARGTRMDVAYRDVMQGKPEGMVYQGLCDDGERRAVRWAVNMTRILCGEAEVITDKERCAFPQWHANVKGGEADAICPEGGILIDLKSGQVRNYWEQQACYAKAVMEREFLDELTCHLLFCDQQEVVSRKFSYEEAVAMVNDTVEGIRSATGPTICEYCEWCTECDRCAVRNRVARESLAVVEQGGDVEESFALICEDTEKLSSFLKSAAVVAKYEERGRKLLQERIKSGVEVEGWALRSRKGSAYVAADKVRKYAAAIGAGNIIEAYGALRADKFRALWAENMNGKEFPEDVVITGAGSSFIQQTPKKRTK